MTVSTPLGRATQVVLTAHWNDQDETAGIEVFTLLAEAGSPWKPQSTLDAPDEPYLFERWMEQISPSQREVVDKLQPIVDRANAQLRKNQLETLLEPAAIEPEVARSPRAPRF